MLAIVLTNIMSIGAALSVLAYKNVGRQGFNILDFTFFRNLFNLLCISLVLSRTQKSPFQQFEAKTKVLIGSRCFFGFVGFLLWTLGSLYMPLMIHMVILQTAPFWTSILGTILNNEKVSMFEYCSMAVCLTTVVFIVFSDPDSRGQLAGAHAIGFVISFTLSVSNACCTVLNRILKHIHFAVILFYHASFGLATGTVYQLAMLMKTGALSAF